MPSLVSSTGGTSSGTNGMTSFTNVAAEFASVGANDSNTGTDQGELGNGSINEPSDVNHRSWHPVMFPTGRDEAERGGNFSNIRAPFADNMGTQTMHCSDCHGSELASTSPTNILPSTAVQGPHGSTNDFLLKGIWDMSIQPNNTRGSNSSDSICGRCHDPQTNSGFSGSGDASHSFAEKSREPCMSCHIAVPHGWKNKAFLVNLECVGDEAQGFGAGCTDTGRDGRHTYEPYYNNAFLRIRIWQESGGWTENSCGNPNMNDDWYGKTWMEDRC
jgi:hypothetical protein